MVIRLKWGQTEYKGMLESIDSYMNVLLRDTEEFIDGKNTGTLGLVLIRYVLVRRRNNFWNIGPLSVMLTRGTQVQQYSLDGLG